MSELSQKQISAFNKWLSSNGAEVLAPTNEWECVRFKAGGATSIIYMTKTGRLTFTGNSFAALSAFNSGKPWRAAPATKRSKTTPEVKTLLRRDGDLCFYCLERLVDDTTVEHLVSVTHGGPNHISNKYLAHAACNAKAGNLSAPEKIEIRMRTALSKARMGLPL